MCGPNQKLMDSDRYKINILEEVGKWLMGQKTLQNIQAKSNTNPFVLRSLLQYENLCFYRICEVKCVNFIYATVLL
jgi:hypothetical protein